MAKGKRRAFTKEFKAQTVRLVRDSGKSIGVIARELDLGESVLRNWVRQAEVDAGRPGGPDDRRARGGRPAPSGSSDAAHGARHPKKSDGLLCQGECVRFAFIWVEKASFPVRMLCRVLAVSRAGFYAWQGRAPSARTQADERLGLEIATIHA